MKMGKRVLFTLLAAVLIFGGTLGIVTAEAGSKVETVETKTGVNVQKNSKASVDLSNLAEGYVIVKYTGGKDVRIRCQIVKSKGVTYTYDLDRKGGESVFPLTEGDGSYTITVYENTTGTKYAKAFSCTASLKLRNEFLPFLYTNDFVSYNEDSEVVAKAEELVGSETDELKKLTAVFDFVVDNFKYDYALAKTVKSGYIPDLDAALEAKKGICFDYAAVMTAMLRSQNIPCKLVFGHAGTTYHAWIDVYIEGEGWIGSAIRFDGKDWTLMDPTFVSTGKRSTTVMTYVTTESNYVQKYAY